MSVGGCHDDTSENLKDTRSLAKCHAFSTFLVGMIVGGFHYDTCENLENAPSLVKIHVFSMSRPIKQHVTTPYKTKYLVGVS